MPPGLPPSASVPPRLARPSLPCPSVVVTVRLGFGWRRSQHRPWCLYSGGRCGGSRKRQKTTPVEVRHTNHEIAHPCCGGLARSAIFADYSATSHFCGYHLAASRQVGEGASPRLDVQGDTSAALLGFWTALAHLPSCTVDVREQRPRSPDPIPPIPSSPTDVCQKLEPCSLLR